MQPQLLVSQKALTPRPHSSSKSPLEGWGGDDSAEKDTVVGNGVDNDNALHNNVEGEEEFKGQNVFVTNAIENEDNDKQGKTDGNDIGKTGGEDVKQEKEKGGNKEDQEKGEQEKEVTEKIENLEIVTDRKSENDDGKIKEKGMEDVTSVQKTEVTSEASDTDKTEVKTEDYLGK